MGLNKLYIRDIDSLIDEIPQMGYSEFRKRYGKYDILIGDAKSIEFISSIVHTDRTEFFKILKGHEKEMADVLKKNIKRYRTVDAAVAISFKQVLP